MSDDPILGMREDWGQDTPVFLGNSDRRHHLYVIGQTGSGKSTLLENLALQDIFAGRGIGFVDPHGDSALAILDRIPGFRQDDVVYLDPSDGEASIGMNLLANVPRERRHLVASGVVRAFKGLNPDFFGPRMEYFFAAAVAALLDCQNTSLFGLQRMLTDERYRAWVVRQVKDPVVRYIWTTQFESYDRKTQAEIVSPILNKVGPLFMTPQVRHILGQVRSRVDARFMMDNGRIFIANLSKGLLGEDKTNILGSFLVSQFEHAAMSRANVPRAERRDFFLYVDEFQAFVTSSFASLLSEARKYRLCLTLAHQYTDQLQDGISEAVVGNVGSLVSFRVGHDDAEALEKAFGRTYAASAFTSLNNGEVYAKLLSNGRNLDAFRARTFPPFDVRRGRAEDIIKRSRERYGTRREDVEAKIARWLNKSPGF